jgi:hypothetical protein
MTKQNEVVVDAIRTWIFPGLAALVGAMMWSTLNEIKSDLKILMAQSAIDKTRIDNLERAVFNNKANTGSNIPIDKRFPEPPYNVVAVVPPREELIAIKIKKKVI